MLSKALWSSVLLMILAGDLVAFAYVEPDWWPLIESTFDGVNLKRCHKRNDATAPPNGTGCSNKQKTCFFDDQTCNGEPYPLTECFCDGSAWQCKPAACPEQDTVASQTTVSPPDVTEAPVIKPAPETSAPAVIMIPASTAAPATKAPVVVSVPATTGVPVTAAPGAAPGPHTTVPPATEAPVVAPVPATTGAPFTEAPVVALVPGQSTIPPCPSLQDIMADSVMSCVTGLQCFYDFSGIEGADFCKTSKECRCISSGFDCNDDVTCTDAPTCPELDARQTSTCTVPGFGCQYDYFETVGDQRCGFSETCTCKESGSFECVIVSEECNTAPVCPESPTTLATDPTCTAAAFSCTYTTVEPISDELCTVVQTCTCSELSVYVCSTDSTTCEAREKCPATPAPDQSCSSQGLGCTYTIVRPIGGQLCTEVNTCTCTESTYSCEPVQTCEDIPPQICPTSLADLVQDPTCAVKGAGCSFRAVESLSDQICSSVNNCTCNGTEYMCEEVEFTCQKAGTCPSVMEFQHDMSCKEEGLGCTLTFSENKGSEVCTVIEKCSCSSAGQFECETDRTCQPAPTCPTQSPRDGSCDFQGLECVYTYSNITDAESCETSETCHCDGSTFTCEIDSVICKEKPSPPPTPTCPSVETFLTGSRDCPGSGITCTYTITSTSSNNEACVSTSVCPCTEAFLFDCTTTDEGTGC